MPEEVHQMKQCRVALRDAPVERERGEREWPVHLAAEIGWPVRGSKRSPHALERMHERIPGDDVEIVHRESVPQRRQIRNEGAGSDGEIQAAVGYFAGKRHVLMSRGTKQVIAHDMQQRRTAVAPGDLFPLRVRATAVGDRDFPNTRARLREPGGDLNLETEAIRREGEPFEQVGPHELVARFEIGEVQVREHVGQQGQKFVAYLMPEIQYAMGTTEKA